MFLFLSQQGCNKLLHTKTSLLLHIPIWKWNHPSNLVMDHTRTLLIWLKMHGLFFLIFYYYLVIFSFVFVGSSDFDLVIALAWALGSIPWTPSLTLVSCSSSSLMVCSFFHHILPFCSPPPWPVLRVRLFWPWRSLSFALPWEEASVPWALKSYHSWSLSCVSSLVLCLGMVLISDELNKWCCLFL